MVSIVWYPEPFVGFLSFSIRSNGSNWSNAELFFAGDDSEWKDWKDEDWNEGAPSSPSQRESERKPRGVVGQRNGSPDYQLDFGAHPIVWWGMVEGGKRGSNSCVSICSLSGCSTLLMLCPRAEHLARKSEKFPAIQRRG